LALQVAIFLLQLDAIVVIYRFPSKATSVSHAESIEQFQPRGRLEALIDILTVKHAHLRPGKHPGESVRKASGFPTMRLD
jgi:hypothetical protein